MQEKREVIRIKKLLVLRYAVKSDEYPLKWDISTIKDISSKGVCVTARSNLQIGTELLLVLTIPFRPFKHVETEGQVVSADELKTKHDVCVAEMQITRIRFAELKEEDKKLIDEYVHWFWETHSNKKGKSQSP